MDKRKVCFLVFAVLFVVCGIIVRVQQTKTEESENISERFNNCSDHAYYECTDGYRGMIDQYSLAGRKINTFTRLDLGIKEKGELSLRYVNKNQMLVSKSTEERNELWIIPLKREGNTELADAARARKVLEEKDGIMSAYIADEFVCYYDEYGEYKEYDVRRNRYIKLASERFTSADDFGSSPNWRETIEKDSILLCRMDQKGKREKGLYLHKMGTDSYELIVSPQHCDGKLLLTSGNGNLFFGYVSENGAATIYQYNMEKRKVQNRIDFNEKVGIKPSDLLDMNLFFDENLLYIFVESREDKDKNILYVSNDLSSDINLIQGFSDKVTENILMYNVYDGCVYYSGLEKESGVLYSYNSKTGFIERVRDFALQTLILCI